jgi:hypothetical protein
LKKAAGVFFRWNPDYSREMKLLDTVSVIQKEIKINGKAWSAGSVAEYLAPKGGQGRGYGQDTQKIYVGRIHSFIVVDFTVAGAWRHGQIEPESTLFVQMSKYAERSISLAGPPGCGHYRVRKESCTTSTRYVHVSSLTTQYAVMPDNRGPQGVQLMQLDPNSVPDTHVYLVPCEKAFED